MLKRVQHSEGKQKYQKRGTGNTFGSIPWKTVSVFKEASEGSVEGGGHISTRMTEYTNFEPQLSKLLPHAKIPLLSLKDLYYKKMYLIMIISTELYWLIISNYYFKNLWTSIFSLLYKCLYNSLYFTSWPTKLKYLLPAPLQKKFAGLRSRISKCENKFGWLERWS